MKQILCVHLKSWPTDRLKRKSPALRDSPLVLIESTATKQWVAEACALARASGVRPAHTLAEARALCPGVIDAPFEPEKDLKALEALARWMIRFTPIVSIEKPNGLFLDVTGSERLFSGLGNVLRMVQAALERFEIHASAVIAPTAGAAWALACSLSLRERAGVRAASRDDFSRGKHFSPDALTPTLSRREREQEQIVEAISPLNVDCLRIDPAVAAALHRVGIETIGQLLKLPRETLPSRFGQHLLDRIDQALGKIDEPLLAIESPAPIRAKMEFDGAVDSLEAVWIVLQRLLDQIIADLLRRGCGAWQLHARFSRPYLRPIESRIQLSQPSRDKRNLFNLLQCALEKLQTNEGFDAIELFVPHSERIEEEQIALLDQDHYEAEKEYAHLIERMQIRLGPSSVVQARWVESYVPERTCIYLPAVAGASTGGRGSRRADPYSSVSSVKKGTARQEPRPPDQSANRPLSLLSNPREIPVVVAPSEDREGKPIAFTYQDKQHRLTMSKGPERIAGEWWSGHNKTRDYFEVEDEEGRRFWIFRVLETFKWYLHGEF